MINKENEYRLKQKEEKKKIEQEKMIKLKDENPEKFLKKKAANDVAVTKNKQNSVTVKRSKRESRCLH